MNNIKLNKYSSEFDINAIFERKIELGAVIQFNLLQTVLEEFIKRQQLMNDKISKLESKIITPGPLEKDNNLDLLLDKKEKVYIYENGFNKQKENNNNRDNNIKVEKFNNIEKAEEKDNLENNEIKDNQENQENEENQENIDDKNIESIKGIISDDKDLYKKIEQLEHFLKELAKSNNEIKYSFNEFKTQTSHANKFHENKINELFKKISYISDVELLRVENKPNTESNNLDVSKDMINSIEKNLSERIENIEKRSKINDDSLYSMKKDIVTIKTLNDNISKLAHTNQENIIKISKDLETKINLLDKKFNDEIKKVKENCDNNYKENRYEIIKYSNELNDKINNIMNELKKSGNNKNINISSFGNEKLNELNNDLKNYINKSITDTERYLKSLIKNLSIDTIKKNISEINEEINQNKLLKKDIELINNKITDTIEKKIIELSQRLEAQSTDVNLCNDTCNKTVKMVEYLSGQVVQTYQPDLDKNKINTINYKDLKQEVDMASYMTKNLFKEEKNKILKKIEKTLEIESENYIFIKKLEERLKFLASENDLRNMEQSFISLIEELKALFNKKFWVKNEAQKSLRIIEMQLKQMIETGILNNKDSETWLLAKKPINNYVCASCETYLGELKNKNIFLPWNKIPLREEKKYRMGQGFSKMLQLVNMDILKNADMVNTNMLYKYNDKNDEKKSEDYKKLPKIKSQLNIFNQNKTYSIMPSNDSVDHVEYGLNNSADNIEQIDENNKSEGNNMKSYYNKSIEKGKSFEKNKNNIGFQKNSDKINKSLVTQSINNQEPKVMRIVKLNKK